MHSNIPLCYIFLSHKGCCWWGANNICNRNRGIGEDLHFRYKKRCIFSGLRNSRINWIKSIQHQNTITEMGQNTCLRINATFILHGNQFTITI